MLYINRFIGGILFFSLIPTYIQASQLNSPWSWGGYAVGEDVSNMHGGLRRGSIITANGHIAGVCDSEAANLWSGGQFTVGLLGIAQTHNQGLYTGALQVPSNMSATPEIRISDLAYQHKFSKLATARAGIMDIDSYFNVTEAAANLLNSAFINTMSMSANTQLATYPYPGFAAMAELGAKIFGLQLGAFQGNPRHQGTVFRKGQMLIGEFSSYLSAEDNREPQYIIKAGIWKYNQPDPLVASSTHGLYAIAQARWQTKSGRNLGAALQFGSNPKKENTIVTSSVAGCFSVGGIFTNRPKDSINFGAGKTVIQNAKSEIFYEISYALMLTAELKLTPDLQYIVKPSGVSPNAWVGIMRLTYTL